MAVFDRSEANKVKLDDTYQLVCEIEAAENQQGHTNYVLKVQRSPLFEATWHLSRRYSDFDALNNLLLCSGIELPLPPKKVFGKLEREFVAERQQGLQNYINFVLSHPVLSTTLFVKRFFDPDKYSFNFTVSSLQHVSMVFRSETEWEIIEPLSEFGWRLRKQYFLVKSKSNSSQLSVLSWMDYGPDKAFEDKDLGALTKLLTNLKHPYIYPSLFTCLSEKGCLVINNFIENGTLRDMLCKVKPKSKFIKKYGNPKSYAIVNCEKIQLYGRQILLALKFLHDKGLYHGHLHTGNIALINGTCQVMDIGNSIMGVPSLLRPHFLLLRKIQTMESIDVYCFGLVIYEMAFGSPLEQPTCDSFPPSASAELRSVLEATITLEAGKKGLPSVSDLLLHPYFVHTLNGSEERVHCKVSSQCKESYKRNKDQSERRLKDEQKVIRRSQRMSKVHAQLSSEEEKKKRLTERKKVQRNLNITNAAVNGQAHSPTPTESSIEACTPVPSMTPTSPPPPPPPFTAGLPPPPPPPPTPSSPIVTDDRNALLSSIQGFNKGKLKKSETKDFSSPKL